MQSTTREQLIVSYTNTASKLLFKQVKINGNAKESSSLVKEYFLIKELIGY